MADKTYILPPIKRLSALAGQIESGRFGNIKTEPGIFIKENHPLSIVQLETREPPAKDFLTAIKNLFGFEVPLSPNTSSVSDKTRIIWTGPNRWLIIEPGAAIDFHPEAFLINHCVQTTFFNLSALICCLDENRFNIFIARGFALDLLQKVQEAAEEFGYETL